jgi:hypothetical protein
MRKMKHKIANKARRGPNGAKKYKLKTHSGSKKRFRFTKTGLVKMGHVGKRHNMYAILKYYHAPPFKSTLPLFIAAKYFF